MKHSIQPVVTDEEGVARFTKNKLVEFLLDNGPYDLNDLACMNFDRDDWEHFSQLIGYSISGWGELSYVSDSAYAIATAKAEGASEVKALEALIATLEQERTRTVNLLTEVIDSLGGHDE